MKLLKSFILILCLFSFAAYADEVPFRDEILSYSQTQLPHCGTLKQLDSDHFVYLDITNDYIYELIKFIEADGFLDPVLFDGPDPIGAHISVIYGDEAIATGKILEQGQTISFTIKDCIIVRPFWSGVDSLYCIVVDAPELDQIREKYGLPKKQYDFHITIGLKPAMNPS